jgi:hypothetical protein
VAERFFRFHYANAAPQARAHVSADEYSASLRENLAYRYLGWYLAARYGFRNGCPCQAQ